MEQPADIACLTAFQADDVRILLNSKIGQTYAPHTGEDTTGSNFGFQTISGTDPWFENETINP